MVSKTRLGHRMRCSKRDCETRFRLKRHPDEYVRPVTCPACGALTVYSIEAQRRRQVEQEDTCYCNAYPFPHRRASLVMCDDHPDRVAGLEPSDEEIFEYYACLTTPRSG